MTAPQNLPPCRAADIAIVGMGCRFPGADSPEAFWENLRTGVNSITHFTTEELLGAGISPELLARPNYVRANGALQGSDLFDAEFFGFSPREAEILDVQQRVFLECAWQACEDAGYDPETQGGSCGVFAGAGLNTYLLYNLARNPEIIESAGGFQVMIANDKDHLATRTSYKLNLRGPSVTVQTACSTSLVAVHLACQSLLAGECDRALAGGVSVRVPQVAGYLHQPGMILSADGYCRAFDEQSDGIVGGNGAGVVVLKRLSDALADGDGIRAIIRGTAINNDGAVKLGYTAPGEEGQQAVIAEAMAVAEVEPESIGYIEAHGTATPLGDLVEIAALTRAFRAGTQRRGFCALGSVKTNIGHLDTAAGIAGLMKTVLMLEHRTLAPSLHFSRPNPRIDFAGSPFHVADRAVPWNTAGGAPRRAGVSSFGIGGTNAHAIIEEAPPREVSAAGRPCQLLVLSARTEPALAQAAENLAAYLEAAPDTELADVAYTLAAGRRAWAHRRYVVAASRKEAVAGLQAAGQPGTAVDEPGEVAFLFPGQGSQFITMGLELYRQEPVFRRELDRCVELLRPYLGFDLRETLFPPPGADGAGKLRRTAVAQPALFAVEYALAELLREWGIQPASMIGHSLGEYVAATLAGVFTLEKALALVALRGRLMQELPEGKMLAVSLSAEEAGVFLGNDLSLAALNGPRSVVLSGPPAAIELRARELTARGVACTLLETSHAFHSGMMEPIMEQFAEAVRSALPAAPRLPFVSNVTGTWITAAEASAPEYWARHLRQPVRFAEGLQTLLARKPAVLVEVGPGRVLANLAKAAMGRVSGPAVRVSLGGAAEPPWGGLLAAAAECWQVGMKIDWAHFYAAQRRCRLPLPTYPFQRQRYFVEPKASAGASSSASRKPIDEWFSIPSWRRSLPPSEQAPRPGRWLVLVDQPGLGAAVGRELEKRGCEVTTVAAAQQFERRGPRDYRLNPADPKQFIELVAGLEGDLAGVVHLWSYTASDLEVGPAQELGFYSLLWLAQALGRDGPRALDWLVVANGLVQVADEPLCAGKATLLGPVRVLPKEFPDTRCRCIDAGAAGEGQDFAALAGRLMAELSFEGEENIFAYRGSGRWGQAFEPARISERPRGAISLRQEGVYLITGGLGGMGRTLAEHLARECRAKLVLLARTALPPREEWDARLAANPGDRETQGMRCVRELEAAGAECLVLAADVANEQQMAEALAKARLRFGRIDGVIHAAGIAGGGLMQLKQRHLAERVFAPKVAGTLVLHRLLAGDSPDFILLASSISAFLGEFGQVDYCAANAFLDAFAQMEGGRIMSVNWDTWEEVGMAAEREVTPGLVHGQGPRPRIFPREGSEAFRRLLGVGLNRVLVAPYPFPAYLAPQEPAPPVHNVSSAQRHPRPQDLALYVAPETETQEEIASIWEEVLGISPIGIHDDFFSLGGHSLMATQIAVRYYELKGVKLTLAGFFETPTVAGVADHAEARQLELLGSAQLAQLVAEVELLPEDEVKRLLAGSTKL